MAPDAAVRQLEPIEIGLAGAMLARAFWDGPLIGLLAPDPARREEVSRWFFEANARYGLLYGDVWAVVGADDAVRGCAIWWAPEHVEPDEERSTLSGLADGPLVVGPSGWARLRQLSSFTSVLHHRVAPDRHWYLSVLGVEPALQGHGIGSRVMGPILDRLDAEGLPAYLETAVARNVAFYRRHGFEIGAEATDPSRGIVVRAMRRDPQTRPSSEQGSITLRARVAGDDAGIVEIHTRQEADSQPLTIARYRAELAETVADRQGEQWVAVEADRVVGVGGVAPAWWTGQPGIYAGQLRIDESHWRQGIGTRLYVLLRSRLIALKATRLLSWVRVDAVNGRRFAEHHGFRETGEVVEDGRLHLPEANTVTYEGLEERLRRAGLRIASLAELGTEDEAFLRALQHLWADSGEGPPAPERLRDAFPSWRREVLHASGLSPETHWVALDGERPVGMTFLKRLSKDAAENDYTGVASTHRGRGIAQALKLRAIAWARQHGVRWFYTSSELRNTPMLAINKRLGYQPGVRRLQVAQDVP